MAHRPSQLINSLPMVAEYRELLLQKRSSQRKFICQWRYARTCNLQMTAIQTIPSDRQNFSRHVDLYFPYPMKHRLLSNRTAAPTWNHNSCLRLHSGFGHLLRFSRLRWPMSYEDLQPARNTNVAGLRCIFPAWLVSEIQSSSIYKSSALAGEFFRFELIIDILCVLVATRQNDLGCLLNIRIYCLALNFPI